MKDKSFTRREFINAAGVGVTGLALSTPFEARATVAHATRELLVYVGTYTQGRSEGVYLLRLRLASGELKLVGSTHGVVNPSYITLDVRRRFLYAVNEVEEFAGRKSGAVSAFAVDQRTGALRFLNQQPSQGGAPCYVTADGSGRFVLVANYVGGNVAVLPVLKDGTLGAPTDVKQHQGSGANRERQEGPHAHCIVLDRANRYAYSCDLGTDKVMVYRFDARGGRLTPNEPPASPMRPGAGPRHLTFHPGGKFAYVLNELNSTVTAFAQDRARGTLKELQTVGTLPAGFAGANTAADIHATPDGRFLYCSNRGHDSIAAFGVDATTGGLRPIGHTPTAGKTPRNFAVDPTGTYLLAANQNSDTIVTFRIDPPTGTLQPTGHTAEVPSPVCLKLTTPFS
jgi:6-phosphogluconolactonase